MTFEDEPSTTTVVDIYSDYTYRCHHWHKDDYSKWKMVDGILYIKHYFNDNYQNSDCGRWDKIFQQVDARIRGIDKILLCEVKDETDK